MDFSMEREASDMAESEQITVPKTRLIRLKEVQHRVGLGRSTIAVLLVPGELLHINDLGVKPVQDDPDVLDAEMMLLVNRQLVHQQ